MYQHTKKIFPIIKFDQYTLREQGEKDVISFFNYYTNPEVNKYILAEIPRNLEEGRRELYYWRNIFYNNEGIYFAIADVNDKMIGSIGLSSYSNYHNRAELSYDLSEEFWRRGIMEKAAIETIKYGFKYMNLNRIEAVTSTYNEASVRLLEKIGFKYEGKLRQHRYHRGKLVDVYIFSVLQEDFRKPQFNQSS